MNEAARNGQVLPARDRPKILAEVPWLYPSPVSTKADGQLVLTTDDELGISAGGN